MTAQAIVFLHLVNNEKCYLHSVISKKPNSGFVLVRNHQLGASLKYLLLTKK